MKIDLGRTSKLVLFYGLAIILVITAIDFFQPTWSLGAFVAPILVLVASSVVLINGMKEKKKDIFRIFGMVIALVAIVGVILSFVGITVAILESAKGIVSALLAIFFIVEGWR